MATLSCSAALRIVGAKDTTRRRAEKQQAKHLANGEYRARFTKALDAELNVEMQQFKERLKNWSRKKLEDEGYALFNLSVRLDGQLFREQILRFHRSFGDGILPRQHRFSQGDIVVISKGMLEADDSFEGVVLERAQRFLRVAVTKSSLVNLDDSKNWRLDLSVNSTTHERCTQAVSYFTQQAVAEENVDMFAWNEAASAVRGLLLLQGDSSQPSQEYHVAVGFPSSVSGKKTGTFKGLYRAYLEDQSVYLNASQKKAIEAALCRRVTLWQGPPGTGKTSTLIKFIAAHCKTGQGRVLACADSNVAVDNLLEGLISEGMQVLRIGQPVKVKEELRNATVEAQLATHPLMKKSIEARQGSVRQRQGSKAASKKSTVKAGLQVADSLWQQSKDLEARAIRDVISRAQVVVATCVGAGDPILDGHRFNACVIDEASQATEPATLIPLLRSGADRLVLVGDPAQLPPTVVSKEALKERLEVSLFEHLHDCGLTAMLLNTQYRMHPAIALFPSDAFYEGRLLSQPAPCDRLAPQGYSWPDSAKPLAFLDCQEGKDVMLPDFSWQNIQEAKLVVEAVKQLLSTNDIEGGCSGIGIITPYNAQVMLLQDMFLSEQRDFTGLEVKSVDGFQGREKEVIIFCTVRSNTEATLGFVSDPRRMNVAMTRARRGLLVIGNSRTLMSSLHWTMWLKHVQDQKLLATTSGT